MPRDCEYLSLDFETRSAAKLAGPKAVGHYRYASDPSTSIICMAWAIGWDMAPELWFPGDPIDPAFASWTGPYRAWNAGFERMIWHFQLRREVGLLLPALDRWHDTAAEAARLGLPRKLSEAARVLRVPVQKDMDGHKLMMKYSRPRKRKNHPDTWWDLPEDIVRIGQYCGTDVEAERAIAAVMPPLRERPLWILDQRINDRGIKLDVPLIEAAQTLVTAEADKANARIEELTAGDTDSVTQTAALKLWVNERHPDLMEDFTKNTVAATLALPDLDEGVREVLQLRQAVGRTSLAKWFKATQVIGYKDRARGLLRYHAAHTGRWGGQLLQPQNFPRPTINGVEDLIPDILAGRMPEGQEIGEVLVSLLRSMVIPEHGFRFLSGDYSQIELRKLAWLSGGTYGDHPYHRMAAKIFDCDWTDIQKDTYEYGIGKNTELGCGFGMGWKKWRDYVYQATGEYPEDEIAQRAVGTYRESHPNVLEYWRDCEDAAIGAVLNPNEPFRVNNVTYIQRGQFLWCILPSGRPLAYALPRIVNQETPWGAVRPALQYMGIDTRWGGRKWGRVQTYGGHLVENIVQATARDVMATAMLRLEEAGYPVVLTVHDEILCEVPNGHGSLEEFQELMQTRDPWAATAPIEAECWEGDRWRK
jgi:DNA polymerase